MQPLNPPWQVVSQLLSNATAESTVERVYPPPPQQLSFLDSMSSEPVAADAQQLEVGTRLRSEIKSLLHQLVAAEKISRCPILGITGILNSGKSSLLATYLSPQNRSRVLRGVSNESGTHRFVLWLPQRWKDQDSLLEPLQNFVTNLFGHAPEPLSDDPDEAAKQYNGQLLATTNSDPRDAKLDPISVPLIAFDPSLNDLQLGLLDCPDIQTGFAAGRTDTAIASELPIPLGPESDTRLRQKWLAAIGRLCSAFVVVTKLNSLNDQSLLAILTILRDCMPTVPRILAVNRVKARYTPNVVAEESQILVDRFRISSVYTAYDYRSALAESVVPPVPKGMLPDDRGPQPIFFQVSDRASSSTNQTQSQVKYLYNLGEQLDVGSLSIESNRSLVSLLKTKTLEMIEWHEQNPTIRRQQIRDAWSALARACYEFMAEHDASGKFVSLRLQTSPALVAQMSESLRRTAPMWMKLSLKIDSTARQLQQAISEKAERFKLLQNASQAVTEFVRRWRSGDGAQVVTPDRIAASIRKFDMNEALIGIDNEHLAKHCEQALKRFSDEDQPELDQKSLDQWSKSIWDNMPMATKLRKGVQPLALVTGPLLAALLVPFDGGGSAVLVFASTKELLAAAGLAALVTPIAGGGETIQIVQEETPWRQLSDLFAMLCDSLSLPRPSEAELPSCGSALKRLLLSRTACQPIGESPLSLWMPVAGALENLASRVSKL